MRLASVGGFLKFYDSLTAIFYNSFSLYPHIEWGWSQQLCSHDLSTAYISPPRPFLPRRQVTGPHSLAFHAALRASPLDAAAVAAAGQRYQQLLLDLDALLQTDPAFMVGPWLQAARAWGQGDLDGGDCNCTGYATITSCRRFYEWNARVQITTWNPTPKDAVKARPPRRLPPPSYR